jgi:hypothetical protein
MTRRSGEAKLAVAAPGPFYQITIMQVNGHSYQVNILVGCRVHSNFNTILPREHHVICHFDYFK